MSDSIKVCNWFVCYKLNDSKLNTALFVDYGVLSFDEDSGNVTFCSDEIGVLSVNLN